MEMFPADGLRDFERRYIGMRTLLEKATGL